MILNINQLRSFYFAARLKSITRAAQELMVTPPAITIQIKQLEESLGIWLIFRDGHSMQLTEVGKILFNLSIKHSQPKPPDGYQSHNNQRNAKGRNKQMDIAPIQNMSRWKHSVMLPSGCGGKEGHKPDAIAAARSIYPQ